MLVKSRSAQSDQKSPDGSPDATWPRGGHSRGVVAAIPGPFLPLLRILVLPMLYAVPLDDPLNQDELPVLCCPRCKRADMAYRQHFGRRGAIGFVLPAAADTDTSVKVDAKATCYNCGHRWGAQSLAA